MFYFLWAAKNLYRNEKKTIEIIFFIAIISMMFFMNFAFLDGSQKQMKETTRNFLGDIKLDARSENYSLSKIKKELESEKEIATIISEYSFNNVRVISDNGYSRNSSIKGYSPNYFAELDKSVEWIDGNSSINKPNQVVIERSMATKLSVSAGDKITVEFKTEQGAVNTAVYKVSGIFIGNKYIHKNSLFVTLESARNLGMVEDNFTNHLKIYLKNPNNTVALSKLVNNKLKKFDKLIYVKVWQWEEDSIQFTQIFKYSRIFFIILISLTSVVLFVVLFFGIQNIFYLTFTKRSNEISVLSTFGMPFLKIYKTIFWETIFLFSFGLLCGFLFSLFVSSLLGNVSFAQVSEEMVVILGGSNLKFVFELNAFLWVVLFLFVSGLYASFHSLRKYFKLEIREMKGGI